MADGDKHNVLPERLQNHSMAKTREYVNYDEKEELWLRPPGFMITIPGVTFLSPEYFNADHDPYKVLEQAVMEKGDYLLVSPVKTGTHWMFEIMRMLCRGSSEYDVLPREAQWLDMLPLEDVYSSCASPRVLSLHAPLSYSANFRRKDTKVVFMMRNLKDVIVSYYHHQIQKKPKPYDSREEFNEFFKETMYSKYVPYGNHFDAYADCWDKHRDDGNVLIVMYEDLHKKSEETIQKVAQHMGVSYTPQLIRDISNAVCMSKLKPAKYESETLLRKKFGENFSLFRTGKMGDWKEWFTYAQNEEFHRVFDDWNKDRQIPMVFEL